ncbi:MAG TPA: hypothetical protein VLJ61_17830 [Pyrinomonadaceae bacterium]|nr:hypothetical protein [Pyrinomonadaceae bacterium]
MSRKAQGNKMTAGERRKAKLLRWSPPFVFLALALPLPAYFLTQFFRAAESPGEYMVFALTSLFVFSVFGLAAALAVFTYRKLWERRLRERLAADGVTADELSWFMSELPAAQRRTLKRMESENPLLADAYRETLASRLTAARVSARARRESIAVERRLKNAARLSASNRGELERELLKDRDRLAEVERETAEHYREMEARLQIIEAMASRDASHAETRLALERLGSVRDNLPLGLAAAISEQDAREEVERELDESPPDAETPRSAGQTS